MLSPAWSLLRRTCLGCWGAERIGPAASPPKRVGMDAGPSSLPSRAVHALRGAGCPEFPPAVATHRLPPLRGTSHCRLFLMTETCWALIQTRPLLQVKFVLLMIQVQPRLSGKCRCVALQFPAISSRRAQPALRALGGRGTEALPLRSAWQRVNKQPESPEWISKGRWHCVSSLQRTYSPIYKLWLYRGGKLRFRELKSSWSGKWQKQTRTHCWMPPTQMFSHISVPNGQLTQTHHPTPLPCVRRGLKGRRAL